MVANHTLFGSYNLGTTPNGGVVITGGFRHSAVFSTHAENIRIQTAGDASEGFIAKFGRGGSFRWVTSIGSRNNVEITDVSIGEDGELLVEGAWPYLEGPPAELNFQPSKTTLASTSRVALFLAKYNRRGELLWARKAEGGPQTLTRTNSSTFDGQGNVIVTGRSRDVPRIWNTTLPSPGEFIARLDEDGDVLRVAAFKGSPASVTVDGSQNIVVGANDRSSSPYAGFVRKLSQNFETLWTFSLPATLNSGIRAITILDSDDVVFAGWFRGELQLPDTTLVASPDAFSPVIGRLDETGRLLWIRHGTGLGLFEELSLEAGGDIVAGGEFQRKVTFADPRGNSATAQGQLDGGVFVTIFSPDGTPQRSMPLLETDFSSFGEIAADGKGSFYMIEPLSRHRPAIVYARPDSTFEIDPGQDRCDLLLTKYDLYPGPVPATDSLEPGFPNPFSHETFISFGLPEAAHVSLIVYDVLGRELARLIDEQRAAGTYRVAWRPSGLSAGIYFGVLHVGERVKTIRMVHMP